MATQGINAIQPAMYPMNIKNKHTNGKSIIVVREAEVKNSLKLSYPFT